MNHFSRILVLPGVMTLALLMPFIMAMLSDSGPGAQTTFLFDEARPARLCSTCHDSPFARGSFSFRVEVLR